MQDVMTKERTHPNSETPTGAHNAGHLRPEARPVKPMRGLGYVYVRLRLTRNTDAVHTCDNHVDTAVFQPSELLRFALHEANAVLHCVHSRDIHIGRKRRVRGSRVGEEGGGLCDHARGRVRADDTFVGCERKCRLTCVCAESDSAYSRFKQ